MQFEPLAARLNELETCAMWVMPEHRWRVKEVHLGPETWPLDDFSAYLQGTPATGIPDGVFAGIGGVPIIGDRSPGWSK